MIKRGVYKTKGFNDLFGLLDWHGYGQLSVDGQGDDDIDLNIFYEDIARIGPKTGGQGGFREAKCDSYERLEEGRL